MLLIYVNQNIGYFCDEMIFNFYKYHGTGNDFIIIYGEHYVPSFSKENIIKLCDRKYGIGADGVMLIKYHEDYDFEMQFYNPDGSSSFCGNGSRCAVLFCFHNGICTKKCTFLTNDGPHKGEVLAPGTVKIDIKSPVNVETLPNGDFSANTGSPHYVKFTEDINYIDFISDCKAIRHSEPFNNEGINVNMVEVIKDEIKIRTFERGVEDETLSCGSGVTAAALCYAQSNDVKETVNVRTKGGLLKVIFSKEGNLFCDIHLIGPAQFIYRGEIQL